MHTKQTEGCYGRGVTSFFTFGLGDTLNVNLLAASYFAVRAPKRD
ncbi:unnamed protein product [Ectocarpus sp. 6 AP-2014]